MNDDKKYPSPLTDALWVQMMDACKQSRISPGAADTLFVSLDQFRALEVGYSAAAKVVRLSDEYCNAIDAEDGDIGGSRPSSAILSELGPATDEALRAIKNLKEAKR